MSTDAVSVDKTKPRFKIAPRRVKSDDCLIYPDRQVSDAGEITSQGEGVAVHVGEWVEILPVQSMRELIAIGRIASQVNSDTEMVDRAGQSGEGLYLLCQALADRVTAWNWTGNTGQPLPQPYKRPEVLTALSNDELMHLVQAARGETPDERKKG